MKIEDYLSENFGYDPGELSLSKWHEKFAEWQSWYIGYNSGFHSYTIYNGKSKIKCRRLSIQLAKKCCEDWADILFNINCKIKTPDKNSDTQLDELLSKNDFWLLVNQAIEKSFAIGTGALVVSVNNMQYDNELNIIDTSTAVPAIEFVSADKIYPISWDNKNVTECAFCNIKKIKGRQFAFLAVHYIGNNGNYIIHNRIFEFRNGEITDIDPDTESAMSESLTDFDTGSNKRWFVLLSPAIANNIMKNETSEINIPFGISVFANAIDSIKASDKAFDSLCNEIDMGRKRIFVRGELLENDLNGNPVFDASDISVYKLPPQLKSDDLIQPENSELRTAQICEALKTDLSLFSQNVGMGRDMYSFDISNVSTATQVRSTNSELKRKRDKHKTKIENELYDLLNALIYAADNFSSYNINPDGLTIEFDDSFFEDVDTEANRKMREIDMNLASPYEYRTTVYNEDIETAKKNIKDIQDEYLQTMKKTSVTAPNSNFNEV